MPRPLCSQCGFIESRCLCATLTKIFNEISIIILQHPSEVSHALNTVKLLKKSFQNIEVYVGENFNSHPELNTLIREHEADSLALLFPRVSASALHSSQINITHLILIDGTWKKAKKIFAASTILHQLPCFSLAAVAPSDYLIRTSEFSGSLSTLEATISALSHLSPALDTSSLKKSFDKMINFQIDKMGEEIFVKNYKKKL